MNRLAHSLRELGPYALIALTVPGGTVIALAMWALQRHARWISTHAPWITTHAPWIMIPVRRALSTRRPHDP